MTRSGSFGKQGAGPVAMVTVSPASLPKDALEGSGRAWQWLLPQNAGRACPEKGAEPPRRGRSHRFLTESPPQRGPSEGALTSPLVTIITVPALSPPNSPEN